MGFAINKRAFACAALAALLAALALTAAPPSDGATKISRTPSWCTKKRDVCTAVYKKPVRFRVKSYVFDGPYKVCVTRLSNKRKDCVKGRMKRIRGKGSVYIGLYGGTIPFKKFSNRGKGRFRVKWIKGKRGIGPALKFRV